VQHPGEEDADHDRQDHRRDLGDGHHHEVPPGDQDRGAADQQGAERQHRHVRIGTQAPGEGAAQAQGGHEPGPRRAERPGAGPGLHHPQRAELEDGLGEDGREHQQGGDGQEPAVPAQHPERGGDVAAQRLRLARLVQARLPERRQPQDREGDERQRGEVGDPGSGHGRERAPTEGAEHQRRALDHPHPAQDRLEALAGAGLLQDRVVDDGVDRAGLHGEVHAQQQGGDDVAGDIGAEPAHHDAEQRAHVADDQDAPPAPPVGEDPRGNLEQRHHRGVGGGHEADGPGREAQLGQEQLLDRHPEGDAAEEGRRSQRGHPAVNGAGEQGALQHDCLLVTPKLGVRPPG
jgi:hypothetical protein